MNLHKTAVRSKRSHSNTKPTLKPKNPSAIKSRDPESSVSPWLEDYLDLQSMKMKPISEASIERISLELVEWSKQEDSLVFRDFYDNKNIPEDAYYRWINTYPILKAAHNLAKGRIGSRREKGVITRKYEASSIIGSMPMYDKEWKDLIAWKSSLKEQSATGNITINLPNISTAKPQENE